jgi:hypothetical protein
MPLATQKAAFISKRNRHLAHLLASALGWLLVTTAPASAQVPSVPLTFRETSGQRPYVTAHLNGKPLLLMVHANASFTVMTTHQHAAQAKVGKIKPIDDKFGITEPGKVSALGRGTATLQTLQVGPSVMHDVRLSVFEIPQTPPVDGMLGIEWLKNQRVLVDFQAKELRFSRDAAAATAEGERLRQQGYQAHPLQWNPDTHTFTVPVALNGHAATFTISTVAHLTLDQPFATQAQVPSTVKSTPYGGPTGTTGTVSISTGALTLVVDGQPVNTTPATILDTYAYEAQPRPADTTKLISGILGCDFMLANHAVIDFGQGILYLKP